MQCALFGVCYMSKQRIVIPTSYVYLQIMTDYNSWVTSTGYSLLWWSDSLLLIWRHITIWPLIISVSVYCSILVQSAVGRTPVPPTYFYKVITSPFVSRSCEKLFIIEWWSRTRMDYNKGVSNVLVPIYINESKC